MEKKGISAVYDEDLLEFLESIGEDSRLKKGKCKCYSCSVIMTEKNIAAVFPHSGSVKYICDNPKCLIKYSEMART